MGREIADRGNVAVEVMIAEARKQPLRAQASDCFLGGPPCGARRLLHFVNLSLQPLELLWRVGRGSAGAPRASVPALEAAICIEMHQPSYVFGTLFTQLLDREPGRIGFPPTGHARIRRRSQRRISLSAQLSPPDVRPVALACSRGPR